MELFDTYSVQFSQVLAVSGQKTLAISTLSVELEKITTAPGTIFRSFTQKSKQTSDYECTH